MHLSNHHIKVLSLTDFPLVNCLSGGITAMTMQVFKYCWHSKDFLSPLNDKSIIPQCQGNRMSLICQMQNQMWFKKRNPALSFFQVLDVCPYAPHLQRKHLWESSPVDRLGSCFRHMSVCHITSADRASTRPATSSNIPTCWIHRGSSNQWDSTPTGMDTATQGGSAPPKLPEVSETLAARHLCGAVYQH